MHTHKYSQIHQWYCFQNRFKHACSSTGFFLRAKLWNAAIEYECFMEGRQEI